MFELLKAIVGLFVLGSGWLLIQSWCQRMTLSCGDASSEVDGLECLGCSGVHSCIKRLASDHAEPQPTEYPSKCDRVFDTKEEDNHALN